MQIDHIYDGAQAYFAYGAHPLADRWAGYSEGARRGSPRDCGREEVYGQGRDVGGAHRSRDGG